MNDPAQNLGGGTAVTASELSFSYGDRRALDSVSFDVQKGQVHAFLGPNGSGKSTLFKILATILPVQKGSVRLLGLDLSGDVGPVRKKIGVVFQSAALDRKLSVRQNLVYAGHLYGLRGAELRRRVDEMLEYTNLTDRAKDVVGELSGGLKRRTELCKGLLPRPELLILDEPTTGLDPGARRDLWQFLAGQNELTVLVTTHLMDEGELADQVTILDQGRIVSHGTPAELKRSLPEGEVLSVHCQDPELTESLAADIRERFGRDAQVIDGSLRFQSADAHRFVGELVDAFGDRLDRVELSHPSLEDVFIRSTGHRFFGKEAD